MVYQAWCVNEIEHDWHDGCLSVVCALAAVEGNCVAVVVRLRVSAEHRHMAGLTEMSQASDGTLFIFICWSFVES